MYDLIQKQRKYDNDVTDFISNLMRDKEALSVKLPMMKIEEQPDADHAQDEICESCGHLLSSHRDEDCKEECTECAADKDYEPDYDITRENK